MDNTMKSSVETLSSELFSSIISFIDPSDLHTLNSLSKTSRTLYHLTVPTLYHSFSYHGMQHDIKHLKRFLDTLNWRPDLASHVKELDLREWGRCAKLEDYLGMMDSEQYELREKGEKAKQKEMEKGTLMDDELVGEDGDPADLVDETYEEERADWSDDTEDDISVNDDEEAILGEELEFLGPTVPYNHDNCLEGQCRNGIDNSLREEGRKLGFERENILYDYWKIWHQESDEGSKTKNENELIILLLSQCLNIRTIYMVMPEVHFDWDYKENAFCQFLENTSALAASDILQKLETLYICSPMHPGGKDHREYDLDFRRLFPLMRLPNLKSLYTLTAYIWWDQWPSPPVDYVPLKHTSNITTLSYDECTLSTHDVLQSLSIFRSLTSFRWTTKPTCFGFEAYCLGFQRDLGKALLAHKDTLEDLYFDNRHDQCLTDRNRIAQIDATAVMIGSLRDYHKLIKLAIDDISLIGHPAWSSAYIPLVYILPPNLEELTLFIGFTYGRVPTDNIVDSFFDNSLFYPAFLAMLRSTKNNLPNLRKINIRLTRNTKHWSAKSSAPATVDENEFEEAKMLSREAGIELNIGSAVEWNADEIREVGNTEVPYFLEQIKGRVPGRDF